MAVTVSGQAPRILPYLNPLGLLRTLWRSRDLIRQFTRRDIEGRYRGSFLGVFWSFVTPLVMLLIYTFLFGVVFQARWGQTQSGSLAEYAIIIFAGITAFNVFSECANRAPTLVIGVPNYVKKVVFPLEILPVSALGAALFHGGISLVILTVANLLVNGVLHWTVVLLPLVIVPLILLSLGVGWFLAALGVYIRDASNAIGLITQILFFATPIFYPFSSIPPAFQPVIRANPLNSIVENLREVVLWGTVPDLAGLALWTVITGIVALLGFAWFQVTRRGFADVV